MRGGCLEEEEPEGPGAKSRVESVRRRRGDWLEDQAGCDVWTGRPPPPPPQPTAGSTSTQTAAPGLTTVQQL